jgi:hypothetical protein
MQCRVRTREERLSEVKRPSLPRVHVVDATNTERWYQSSARATACGTRRTRTRLGPRSTQSRPFWLRDGDGPGNMTTATVATDVPVSKTRTFLDVGCILHTCLQNTTDNGYENIVLIYLIRTETS